MNILPYIFISLLFPLIGLSQNLEVEGGGIISNDTSAVLLLENTDSLATNVSNAMYFKTGDGPFQYTGAVKTIGLGETRARLSLFTYASDSPIGLMERLTIRDGGNVGIGTLNPGGRLEVEGGIIADSIDVSLGLIKNVHDPISAQDAVTKSYLENVLITFGLSLGSAGIEGLINAGIAVSDLFAAGIAVSDLLAAGANPLAILAAGIPIAVSDLLAFGATPLAIQAAGIPIDSLYGKTYAGGLIFYLDTLNMYPSFEGLVLAPSEASTTLNWGNIGDGGDGCNVLLTGATLAGIGDGAMNTMTVLNAVCDSTGGAFAYVDTLSIGGYEDWFLPSKDELYEMYKNLHRYNCSAAVPGGNDLTDCPTSLGGFSSNRHWSSTESHSQLAWEQDFFDGTQNENGKPSSFKVRCIRAF